MQNHSKRRQGKCESCGFAMPYEKGKGAWRFFCTRDGKGRRGGDFCSGYWESGDMKNTIDSLVQDFYDERGVRLN